MKKSIFFALALGLLTIASCSEKKPAEAQPAAEQTVEVITDSAFQATAAGDYKTPDGSTVITLNKDFTVKTNYKKDYYKWELIAKPEGNEVTINLVRKGMDNDVKEQGVVDTQEGKLVVNNETFRKK